MKKVLYFIVMAMVFTAFSGCSVRKAAQVGQNTSSALLSVGQDRTYVLLNLGEPDQTFELAEGQQDVYQLNRNNKYLAYGRVGIYSLLDVGTFGLWELIGTPLEDFIQTEQTVTILYNEDDRITDVIYTKD